MDAYFSLVTCLYCNIKCLTNSVIASIKLGMYSTRMFGFDACHGETYLFYTISCVLYKKETNVYSRHDILSLGMRLQGRASPSQNSDSSRLESHFSKDSDSTRTRDLETLTRQHDSSHSIKKIFICFYKNITIYKIKLPIIEKKIKYIVSERFFQKLFSIYTFIYGRKW